MDPFGGPSAAAGAAGDQALGDAAIAHLAAQPELLSAFLVETGVAPADAAAMVDEPGFLGAALEFLARDEERAAAFCAEIGATPERFAAARARLSGEAPHWT